MTGQQIAPHQQRPGSRRTPLIVTPTGDAIEAAPEEMTLPYRCLGCGKVYDGGKVQVTARYADCSMWKAPCCGATHDDRPAWSSAPGARTGYTDLRAQQRSLANWTGR